MCTRCHEQLINRIEKMIMKVLIYMDGKVAMCPVLMLGKNQVWTYEGMLQICYRYLPTK